MSGSLQASRYELKYLINESLADVIRRHVRVYLVDDEYAGDSAPKGEAVAGYRVQSLYLDSPDLACYHQTADGLKNRVKLRIRFYDESDDSPVFLEIKRRVTQVIQKQRAVVSRSAAYELLRGAAPSKSMLLKDSLDGRETLSRFCKTRDVLGARGMVFVDYYREAFQSRDANRYRVTFDRRIQGGRYLPGQPLRVPGRTKTAKISGVVLEFKYVNEPAMWMIDLASRYKLQRVSVPKYLRCADAVHLPITGGIAR